MSSLYFCSIRMLSRNKWKMLLCYLAIGLLIMAFSYGKRSIDLESIAVSFDEQYIACFETGNGNKIRCFNSDGYMTFVYDIPSDISAGGYCSLWFEEHILCARFYRTDKIVYFATDGNIQKISDDTAHGSSSEYPSFTYSYREYRYVYDGNKFDVVYYKGGFWNYWISMGERYLSIIGEEGSKILCSWTANTGQGPVCVNPLKE